MNIEKLTIQELKEMWFNVNRDLQRLGQDLRVLETRINFLEEEEKKEK